VTHVSEVALHALLAQSESSAHPPPTAHVAQVPLPPQSMPVSVPSRRPSVQLALAQRFVASHTPVVQSPSTLHAPPTPHVAHVPPQSMSLSLPSRRPSPQTAKHVPLMHAPETLPAPAEHVVPSMTVGCEHVPVPGSHVPAA
jgi:hypothetical protein